MCTIICFIFMVLACNAYAQDSLADLRIKIEAQRIEVDRRRADSILKLRQAILNLRDVRQQSCQFSRGPDCYLVEISTIELALLNLEDSYRLAESRVQSDEKKMNYKKIQEVSSSLRSGVGELAQLIEKAER